MNFLHTKKFRYGSVSLALTIVIIAAVILLNAIFTALSEKFVWYIDMTSDQMYTLTDEAKELLDGAFYEDPDTKKIPRTFTNETTGTTRDVEVTFIFCTLEDEMEANTTQRYVLYTVKEMMKEYDQVNVKFVDIYTNPSAVAHYEDEAAQDINAYSVIVTSPFDAVNPDTGAVEQKEKFRVYSLPSLFVTDSTGETINGYNGEQRLVSAIVAVTQVEVPVACYTINHGEADNLLDDAGGSAILTLLYESGYEVKAIDLLKEDIPANCRLLLIFDPQRDFADATELGGVSERAKLDAYMAGPNALMTFFDYDTPVLPNYEAWLAEWGVSIARHTTAGGIDANYLIKDNKNSFDADGIINVGTYATSGLGASINRLLIDSKYPKSVVFKYTGAIAPTYEQIYDSQNACWMGVYDSNNAHRYTYDVFTSSKDAVAEAGGEKVSDATAPFKYMTVTQENLGADANGNTVYANLLACASTDFASASALASSYGNHAVLSRACHALGNAQASVSLDCKYFSDMEIDSITAAEANQYTIVLTVVPAAIIFIAGVYIMVRRRYA